MDTSETYIKMCDCPEIQGQRLAVEWEQGDWALLCGRADSRLVVISDPTTKLFAGKAVWLPTQHQLQEMLDETPMEAVQGLAAFGIYFDFGYKTEDTFEQFWLRHVMFEKHNKRWNGEAWILDPA